MKLSRLASTLIGSEIVKLGGEIKEKIRQGARIYNFTIGDFDPALFPIPKELEEAIVEAYRQGHTNYPAAEGNLDLREAIAHFVSSKEKITYSPEEILVASGGRPLIYTVFRSICDPGDKVVYAVPSWNNNHYTHFTDGEHIVIETSCETRFMPTAAQLAPHLPGATLLSLCSPQNPTGTTFDQEELTAICDLVLAENQRRGADQKKLYVMYDQMYWHLTYGTIQHHNPVSLRPEMKSYTIFIDAISKVFAATGVRVGWALGPATVIQKMKQIMTHIGAWAPMAEQKALALYLRNLPAIDTYLQLFKQKIEDRLIDIYDGFLQLKKEGFPVDAIKPEAAIYLTVQVDVVGRTSTTGQRLSSQAEVTAFLLDKAGLAMVPFSAFGATDNSPWYRMSIGTCKKEEIPHMLLQLKTALQELS